MDDAGIIDLYFNRDEDAIRQSDLKYGAYCHTVAGNILASREDAEECVSDTWLKAWNAMPPTRPNVLKLFLCKLTRNIAIDRYRALAAKMRGACETALCIDELAECVASQYSVEEALEEKELSESVRRFVHDLPEREKAMFIRRYFYVESVSAVAERYGMTSDNASVILSRIRKKLRTHLEKEMLIHER